MLFALLVSGFITVILCSPREYFFVNEAKNWTEAQTHCRDAYTDLATIEDKDDVTRVMRIIGNESGIVWIGLYKNLTGVWKWSLEDESFYHPGEYEFRNWEVNQPSSLPFEECVRAFENNGYWHDTTCHELHIFFCYNGSVNATEPLKLIHQTMNWHSAQTFCRENYKDLASIRNLNENQQLLGIAEKQSFWIGLFKDYWKWSDATNFSFQFWLSRELNNAIDANPYCAMIIPSEGGRWGVKKCVQQHPFLCYKNVTEQKFSISPMKLTSVTMEDREKQRVHRARVKLELNSNSLIDMEDPEVQAAILQQIQRRLQEEGLSSDTKLTWKKQADGKVFQEKRKESKTNKDEP